MTTEYLKGYKDGIDAFNRIDRKVDINMKKKKYRDVTIRAIGLLAPDFNKSDENIDAILTGIAKLDSIDEIYESIPDKENIDKSILRSISYSVYNNRAKKRADWIEAEVRDLMISKANIYNFDIEDIPLLVESVRDNPKTYSLLNDIVDDEIRKLRDMGVIKGRG